MQKRKKRKKRNKWIWLIIAVTAIAVIIAAVLFWFFVRRHKQAEAFQPEKLTVEMKNKSYPAGDRLSEDDFNVFGIKEGTKRKLDDSQYVLDIAQIPEHGHDVDVTVTLTANDSVNTTVSVLIARKEIKRYDIGLKKPKNVQAVIFENGDLDICGSGPVRTYNEEDIPWKEDGVSRLTWIDPNAEPESMDYWFSQNTDYVETLCRIPDTVRSMVRIWYGCTAMTSIPDLASAVSLEDMTSCAEGCVSLEKVGKLPGNVKTTERSFYGCTSLIKAADASACVQLHDMAECYYGCTSLAEAVTPDQTIYLNSTYYGCLNLKKGNIPSGVEDLTNTFYGCTSLETVSGDIPKTCQNVSCTFKNCKFLTGTLVIHCGGAYFSDTFSGAATNGDGLIIHLINEMEDSNSFLYGSDPIASIEDSIRSSAKGGRITFSDT